MTKYIVKYGGHTAERSTLLDAREAAYYMMLKFNLGYTDAHIYLNKITEPLDRPGFKYVVSADGAFPKDVAAQNGLFRFYEIDTRRVRNYKGTINPDGTFDRHNRRK